MTKGIFGSLMANKHLYTAWAIQMTGTIDGNGNSCTTKSQKSAPVSFSYHLWAKIFV
jgi:hypothetical protein